MTPSILKEEKHYILLSKSDNHWNLLLPKMVKQLIKPYL